MQRCKNFFSAQYAMKYIFFRAGIFLPGILWQELFSPEISLSVLKSPIPPSKVKLLSPEHIEIRKALLLPLLVT